jgi:hypothetical protein
MNYENIIITSIFFLIFFGLFGILSYEVFSHSIYLIKNIFKMERKNKILKLYQIVCTGFVFGIISDCFFIAIIGWTSIIAFIIYFCIGFFFGALVGLEEPRPSLSSIEMNEY